jgi:hypothetical protein
VKQVKRGTGGNLPAGRTAIRNAWRVYKGFMQNIPGTGYFFLKESTDTCPYPQTGSGAGIPVSSSRSEVQVSGLSGVPCCCHSHRCVQCQKILPHILQGQKKKRAGRPAGNRSIATTLPGSRDRREQRTGTGRNLAGVHALAEPCHTFGGCTVREGVGHNISL